MAEKYYSMSELVKLTDNLIAALPTSFYSGIMSVRGGLVITPTADVRPVRHGRWMRGDMPTYGGYKCSVCGGNTTHYKANYCPNCGASMDLKDGDGE